MSQDITLIVDYHDRVCVVRRYEHATQHSTLFTAVPTTSVALSALVADARRLAGGHGRVTWIQESTTGWARVKDLLGTAVDFRLANVLQMPLPPKARRRKTDRLDADRLLREHLADRLPLAHQPEPALRQLRRLVAYREDLVRRRTALRNGLSRYLAHETWYNRTGLWSATGQRRLRAELAAGPRTDALVMTQKLDELARIDEQMKVAEHELMIAYQASAEAKRLDAIRGLGPISAISVVARIGPVTRFRTAEELIGFAGLAPGVRASDQTRRDGHIGGGGTDAQLRHYLIEATIWARDLPRYQDTYKRVCKRRGPKVGRLVVARQLLRSIYKMLKEGIAFGATAARPREVARSR